MFEYEVAVRFAIMLDKLGPYGYLSKLCKSVWLIPVSRTLRRTFSKFNSEQ